MNILPKCMYAAGRGSLCLLRMSPACPYCHSQLFVAAGSLAAYLNTIMTVCDGTWSAHQPLETIIPPSPRPRHCRTLGKGAVREQVCASDGHDGLGPRRVIGLGCCCQDKQLCLCLGQVFHSVSAY